jgi:glyoxylase-like metal-dependent hydrolase (beta-lactamase superfamily II)
MLFSRLKIPLPGMELGHVNVYVLRCKDGYGLVDVGLAAYDGALSLVKGLKALGDKADGNNKGLHYPLPCRSYNSGAVSSRGSLSQLLHRRTRTNGYWYSFEELVKIVEEYKGHGAPPDVAEAFLKVHPMARFRKTFEDVWKLPWRSVKDRDLLDCGLKAVWTPGHTPATWFM